MKNTKTVLLAALAIVAVIVVAQNTAVVETRLLFVTVSMPRALLLLATLGIGFALGLLLGRRLRGGTPA